MQSVYDLARNIRLLIFDVDGVLTDGSLYLGDDGQEYKAFNSLDGHGIKMLRRTGVKIAIITGRTSRVVLHRAANLGVPENMIYQGVEDKLSAFLHLAENQTVRHEDCAFMGDDVVDLPAMRRCGLALTVPHAPSFVRQHAHYVTQREGGKGAAREICEMIMHAQGTYNDQMAMYLA